MMENNKENLKKAALDYHRAEPKGKIQMEPSKPYTMGFESGVFSWGGRTLS